MSSLIRILTIVGARPQFIKAAMVSRAIVEYNKSQGAYVVVEEILHTGQHYDENMSQVFFTEMGIPDPSVNLSLGGGLHGEMTGKMLADIEREIIKRSPDWVLIYGDTNSTLAGALAASKLHVPIAHVEAGLRSFNRKMPEEINRVLSDHISSLLLCPTISAVENLSAEGIRAGVHHVGDVMYDAALLFGEIAEVRSSILDQWNLRPQRYILSTIHRAENTDDLNRLKQIFQALGTLAADKPVVLPLHPRTKLALYQAGLAFLLKPLTVLPPVSFLDMVLLEKHAAVIITDSGGVQKEAYFHGVPCVTVRDETEWNETVEAGWNQVVRADIQNVISAVGQAQTGRVIVEYGNGHASLSCVSRIIAHSTQDDKKIAEEEVLGSKSCEENGSFCSEQSVR